jgi:hypothetical protein
MSVVRSRLARYNTGQCEQVMPVPLIPKCAISCCIPQPILTIEGPLQSVVDICPKPYCVPTDIFVYPPEYPTQPGQIFQLMDPNIPEGYLLCDGRPVSRITYAAIFAAIGTSYGEGDGINTFNLPCMTSGMLPFYIIKT